MSFTPPPPPGTQDINMMSTPYSNLGARPRTQQGDGPTLPDRPPGYPTPSPYASSNLRTPQAAPIYILQRPTPVRPLSFSGSDTPKNGETTYREWKRTVRELIRDDPSYSVSIIRNSLRGLPRFHVEDCSRIPQIISRLDELFEDAVDRDSLLAQFYSNQQSKSESAKEYYMRLLSLFKEVCELEPELAPQLSSSLRKVFWQGLKHQQVKATLHYKYDSACPAAELMKAVSKEEENILKTPSSARQNQVSQIAESLSQLQIDKPKKAVRFYDPPPGQMLVCTLCYKGGHAAMECPGPKEREPQPQQQPPRSPSPNFRSDNYRPHKQHVSPHRNGGQSRSSRNGQRNGKRNFSRDYTPREGQYGWNQGPPPANLQQEWNQGPPPANLQQEWNQGPPPNFVHTGFQQEWNQPPTNFVPSNAQQRWNQGPPADFVPNNVQQRWNQGPPSNYEPSNGQQRLNQGPPSHSGPSNVQQRWNQRLPPDFVPGGRYTNGSAGRNPNQATSRYPSNGQQQHQSYQAPQALNGQVPPPRGGR